MVTKTSKPTTGIAAKSADAQAKVKQVAAKAGDVLKANAQVAIDSTKTLGGGLKAIGAGFSGRKVLTTLVDDLKAISKVKSAPEFVRLQGETTARNMETISAAASKAAGEVRTLVADKVAPMVSKRLKANLELFRKAA